MTPQELKNSILQLAIQGKLVEQRPEEGTAQELFEQIQAEKQRLIKAGRLKKEKPLPEITEDEKPFDIPESWMWVHLNCIASSSLGKTLDKVKNTGDLRPYLCSINVYWNGINLEKVKEARFEESELSKYLLQKGDLLICEGGDVGRSSVWEQNVEMYYQNALHRVRFFQNINPYFYKYLIEYYKEIGIIDRFSKGVTIKHLVQSSLNEMWLPLPPLAEQKRIVAKIEELLPYIDRYEQAWSKLEQFNSRFPEDMKKALLQYAIQGKLVEQRPEEGTGEGLFAQIQAEKQRLIQAGKIKKEKGEYGEFKEDEILFDIPATWKWVRFGSIMINRDSERIPLSVAERSKLEKIFDYYGASGVIDKVDRYLFDKTLLLIGEDGANLLTRSTPIAFLAQGQYWVNNHAHVLDCVEGALSLEYMMYFVNAISLGKYVTGTAQPKMNQEKMNSIPVPLPPLVEQKRIVEKLEQLLPLCERLKTDCGGCL